MYSCVSVEKCVIYEGAGLADVELIVERDDPPTTSLIPVIQLSLPVNSLHLSKYWYRNTFLHHTKILFFWYRNFFLYWNTEIFFLWVQVWIEHSDSDDAAHFSLILFFLKQNIFLQMFQYFLLTISLSGVWMKRQLCKNIILMCQSWRLSIMHRG